MKKVVVGISGGVDSAVTAALLKKEGYQVIGLTMMLNDEFDYSDAEKVCNKLGIEFHLLDLRNEFQKIIKDRFLNDYQKGITPNPCVLCNKYIKFGLMYDELLKYDADYIATGHYALIKDGKLYKAEDKNKDQSYFLYNLKKEQLPKILFPLSKYTKDEVRAIALEYDLPVATKKESTDVCFIGKNGFKDYIKENGCTSSNGNIVNIETNEVIGTHKGLMYYTLGQRKGLNIGGTKERLFVSGKDIDNNILYVAMGDENKYLISTSCVLEDVNLLTDLPSKAKAKFRYRQEDNDVILKQTEEGLTVIYPNGVKAVTPGQACVLYSGDECIGGGIIKTVIN